VDILIESTTNFEQNINDLELQDRQAVIEKINYCAELFPKDKNTVYRKMEKLFLDDSLNGYTSSLYTLQVSQNRIVILTIDEDPIFEQTIFTLFRVVGDSDLDRAYKDVAESLYRDFLAQNREIAEIS
jgi:hypothetical protein